MGGFLETGGSAMAESQRKDMSIASIITNDMYNDIINSKKSVPEMGKSAEKIDSKLENIILDNIKICMLYLQ